MSYHGAGTYHTVKLKKYQDINLERVAGGTITPGHLIALNSSNQVVVHVTASGAVTPKMFALEDELQGNGIDDNYTSGNPVQCWVAQAGEEVYAILADGQTIVIGDILESAGDGTLQKCTSPATSDQIVGVALEALDLNTSSAAETTTRIAILVV